MKNSFENSIGAVRIGGKAILLFDLGVIVRHPTGQLIFAGQDPTIGEAVERCNAHTSTEADLALLETVPVFDEVDIANAPLTIKADPCHFA